MQALWCALLNPSGSPISLHKYLVSMVFTRNPLRNKLYDYEFQLFIYSEFNCELVRLHEVVKLFTFSLSSYLHTSSFFLW